MTSMTDEEFRLVSELFDYREAAHRDPDALEVGYSELRRMWSETGPVHGPFNIYAVLDRPGWKFCEIPIRTSRDAHQAPRWVPQLTGSLNIGLVALLPEAEEEGTLRQATAWRVPRELPAFSIVSPWSYSPAVLAAQRAPFFRLRQLVLVIHWAWGMRRPL